MILRSRIIHTKAIFRVYIYTLSIYIELKSAAEIYVYNIIILRESSSIRMFERISRSQGISASSRSDLLERNNDTAENFYSLYFDSLEKSPEERTRTLYGGKIKRRLYRLATFCVSRGHLLAKFSCEVHHRCLTYIYIRRTT